MQKDLRFKSAYWWNIYILIFHLDVPFDIIIWMSFETLGCISLPVLSLLDAKIQHTPQSIPQSSVANVQTIL